MFLGASLGAAYGKILGLILPVTLGGIAAPPAYAMVGMAAVLAASTRAPLTAILLLFELTRDYRIILPLMAAVGLSVWLVERFQPIARNAEAFRSMGLNLQPDQSTAIASQLLVTQAMQQDPLKLSGSASLLQAGLALIQRQSHSAIIMDDGDRPIGIVTLQDVQKALSRLEVKTNTEKATNSTPPTTHQTMRDLCTKDLLYAYDDEVVTEALARMSARGLKQLPVVNRHAPHTLLGLLNQEHVQLICSLAMLQKSLHIYVEGYQEDNIQPTVEPYLPVVEPFLAQETVVEDLVVDRQDK